MKSIEEQKLRGTIGRLREKARRKVPEADVEDLVQEVLVVLVERMQHGQVEALQAYAEGILRHKVYDYYQNKKERLVSLENSSDLSAGATSPEQRVMFMRHLRVVEGLAKENKVDTALVEEHFVRGAPLREVAAQLKVSPGVVNGRLFRFRQKLTQRMGSCFAFILALSVGLWSRVSRALMAVRVYGSVVGMLSIGSFASWIWWGKIPQPNRAPTQQTQVKQNVQSAPVLRPKLYQPAQSTPLQETKPASTQEQIIHKRQIQPNLVFVPNSIHLPDRSLQQTKPVRSKKHPARLLAPIPQKNQRKKPTFVLGLLPIKHTNTFGKIAKRQRIHSQNSPARSSVTQARKAQNTQASTTKLPSKKTPSSRQETPSPRKPTRQTDGPGKIKNPTPSIAPDLQPRNPNKGLVEKNPTSFGNQGFKVDGRSMQPDGAITKKPTKRSFCVKQDGHIYQCNGNSMNDVSGVADSPFGCGSNKMCNDMVGEGPSLLFAQNGDLYILGNKRHRISQDGGQSWTSSMQPEAPAVLLNKALFILNQNGALWQRSEGRWKQVRQHQINVQEVRVHLDHGLVNFEDDTGFKLGINWSSALERHTKNSTPHAPNTPKEIIPKATPETKPQLNQPTTETNTPLPQEPIPVSSLP